MNFITKSIQSLMKPLRRSFSTSGVWKQRQESAEKVYITLEQKKTLERLLGKLEEAEHSPGLKEQQFKQSLKEILRKYDIHCQAFEAEVMNLHRHC